DQAAVAADVLAGRPIEGYEDLLDVQTAFDAATALRSAVAAVNSSGDATEMETALEDVVLGLTLGAYATWSAADQAAVAADVLANRSVGGFVNENAVQTAFDAALASRAPMATVNTET
ncbi:hypothetical protein, partial [Ammoniphilus sp. CFH 90114]|uniref:hypothetical protein n=1 Tax=Ammoniphilus sp. CFH 90114 TaxID=2493665 RepID=UPI0013E969F5